MPPEYEETASYDQRSALLEIHAQGRVAAAFGARLARMYLALAKSRGWETQLIWPYPVHDRETLDTQLYIFDPGAYGVLKYESGLHQLRMPHAPGRRTARRCVVYVEVLPAPAEEEVALQDDDVRVDVFRHGGDRDLGISSSDLVLCMTHLPTGTQMLCHEPKGTGWSSPCLLALRARLLNRQLVPKGKLPSIVRIYDLSIDGVVDTVSRRYAGFMRQRGTGH